MAACALRARSASKLGVGTHGTVPSSTSSVALDRHPRWRCGALSVGLIKKLNKRSERTARGVRLYVSIFSTSRSRSRRVASSLASTPQRPLPNMCTFGMTPTDKALRSSHYPTRVTRKHLRLFCVQGVPYSPLYVVETVLISQLRCTAVHTDSG